MDVAEVAAAWDLAPHPEGGHYRETYRSPLTVDPRGWPGRRALATAILYLLAPGERSARHRVRGEELWLWQGGAPMEVSVAGGARLLGPDPAAGHEIQVLVAAGAWQSAAPVPGHSPGWSLAACVVAPGFDFADFELARATP